jgi:hypothetical protein
MKSILKINESILKSRLKSMNQCIEIKEAIINNYRNTAKGGVFAD